MSARNALSEYLTRLEEPALRDLLVEFFQSNVGEAYCLHGTAEHGIDIAVKIPENKDTVRKVLYLAVQVKCGNIGTASWRNEVLGQLLEASYYPIRHPAFTAEAARRVLLITTGTLEQEVRQSILEYNTRHYVKLEIYELSNLVDLFLDHSFYSFLPPDVIGEGAIPPFGVPVIGSDE